MIRQHVVSRWKQGERYFRWRGGDVSRLEALADAVFALSLTLIVVSLEVPRDFSDLKQVFLQFPVFLACFAILLMCWYHHFLFHRRYGLEDGLTVFLNGVLLFVILFYVYPLKFLFTVLISNFLGIESEHVPTMSAGDGHALILIYSSGFAAVYLVLLLMGLHAWKLRDRLDLDDCEREVTRGEIRMYVISLAIGLLSIGIAALGRRYAPWAGIIYFLVGPAQGIHGYWTGRRVERIAADAGEPAANEAGEA